MSMPPLQLDRSMLVTAPVIAPPQPRWRLLRLRGTTPLVAEALAQTELRFTLVPQPIRKIRFA